MTEQVYPIISYEIIHLTAAYMFPNKTGTVLGRVLKTVTFSVSILISIFICILHGYVHQFLNTTQSLNKRQIIMFCKFEA